MLKNSKMINLVRGWFRTKEEGMKEETKRKSSGNLVKKTIVLSEDHVKEALSLYLDRYYKGKYPRIHEHKAVKIFNGPLELRIEYYD